MENLEKESNLENENSQLEEEKSSGQDNSTDETKDSQPKVEETTQKNEDDEEEEDIWTPPSKEEWEKVQKKSNDFDGIIEKQRLEKLAKKEQKQNVPELKEEDEKTSTTIDPEIIKKVAEEKVAELLREQRQGEYQDGLKVAYREFVKANPWADKDEVIANISKGFNPGSAISPKDILSKIELAAQSVYPNEFKEAQKSKLKSEIMAEENNINIGESGGGISYKQGEKKRLTPEQIKIAEKCGNNPTDVYGT